MQWYVRNSTIYCPKSRKNLLSSQLLVKMRRSTSNPRLRALQLVYIYCMNAPVYWDATYAFTLTFRNEPVDLLMEWYLTAVCIDSCHFHQLHSYEEVTLNLLFPIQRETIDPSALFLK